MTPIEQILETLRAQGGRKPKQSGKGWSARCPAHEDKHPSLSIAEGDDGRVLLNCHTGCPVTEVVAALGLSMRDLMPHDSVTTDRSPRRRHKKRELSSVTASYESTAYSTPEDALGALQRSMGSPCSAKWEYLDASSEPVGVVCRWDRNDGGKDIRPISKNEDGWSLGGMPSPRPLYMLPEVLEANTVYVCEGEKAADAVRSCGLTATTSAHGCKSASQSDWSPLAGKEVIVLPDRDKSGDEYASDVVDLATACKAKSIRIVQLCEYWPNLPKGGDMADVLELLGGDVDAARTGIAALIAHSESIDTSDGASPELDFQPFPVDVLPDPIGRYIIEAAVAIGCDSTYIALPMLSGIGAAIGNSRRLRLKNTWFEPAILWTAIVGESGTAKSPAIEVALRESRKRQHEAMKHHKKEMEDYKVQRKIYEREFAKWKRGKSKEAPPDEPDGDGNHNLTHLVIIN